MFTGIALGLVMASFAISAQPVSAVCDEDQGPTVATQLASEVTEDSATLNAYFSSRDACYTDFTRPSIIFEFGETSSLDVQSEAIGATLGSKTISIEVDDLDPGESYYYRAVMYYENDIVRGDKVKFTTKDGNNSNSGLVITESNTIVNNSGNTNSGSTTSTVSSGSSNTTTSTSTNSISSNTSNSDSSNNVESNGVAGLSIDNSQDIIRNGEYVTYEVSYANLTTDRELEDAVLLVTIPEGMQYISGSDGVSYSTNRNAAIVKLRDVKPGESGEYTVTARVRNIKLDEAIAEVKLTYRDLVQGSRENLTALDIDELDVSTYGSPLAAGLFASGFLPGNVFGWLIIAVLLIAIIYLVRVHFWRYYWKEVPQERTNPREHTIGEVPRSNRV